MDDRALMRFCAIRGRPIPQQIGGGTVLFKGHPIMIQEDITGTFIIIRGGRRTCFIVEIDAATGDSVLLDLEAGRWGDTCFTDNYKDSTALVKVAVWIAKKRGARKIELTDNSTVICKPSGEKIDLAELSFITTGKTWYERLIPKLTPRNEAFSTRLDTWRHSVDTKKWSDIVHLLPKLESLGEPNELAKNVLTRMKKNGEWCEYFANNMDTLRRAFGIESRIKGTQWYAPLDSITSRRKTRK